MIENNRPLSVSGAFGLLKSTAAVGHISCLFRGFLQFYRKKVTKSDRLNVFIVTFATLI